MGLVNIGPTFFPTPHPGIVATAVLLDAASEMAWAIIPITKAGNLRNVHFRTTTVTTGTTALDVRIETIDATNGQPTGTLWVANANIAHNLADTDDSVWLRSPNLTATDIAVVAGDLVAVVLKNPAASFGNFNIARAAFLGSEGAFPYNGGPLVSNKTGDLGPCFLLEYDDGTFGYQLGYLASVMSNLSLDTGTSPDEVALYFTCLVPMRVCGWWWQGRADATADYRVNLYASGNNTPLLTKDMEGDVTAGASGTRMFCGPFAGTQELSVGTVYRLAVLPTTAANISVLSVLDVPASYAIAMDGWSGLSGMHYSARTRTSVSDPDTEAWSQTTTRRPRVGLIIDQLHDGTGGASGGGPLVSGRLVRA